MLLIECPFCGARAETEFAYGGPAAAPRPENPDELKDEEWVDWLIVPENGMKPVPERWLHAKGCGSWLTIMRHTVTHEILEVRNGQ